MTAFVAVVGPGAIGGTVAAWLTQSPSVASVMLCARTPLDRLVVETPDGRVIEATPRVVLKPEDVDAVADWVLIATKAYDVKATARWLWPLVGPQTRVAVLQNGVEHVERFAAFVVPERLLPVVVDIPAERTAPGRIHQRRNGTMVVPAGTDGDAFAALFRNSPIAVSTTEDIMTVAWTKLATNCAGAISALTGRPGGIARDPAVAEMMRTLVDECVAVGRAVGADLSDTLADEVVAQARAAPADSINSMLADRQAGRPMEWDARNGVIVRLGQRHGIDTPANQMVATILRTLE